MARSKKVFAVHPGEILKAEFMEPNGLSAYQLAKALDFPGIYEVVRGDRAISADTAIRLGKYFGLPAQFWLNLQNNYDLRMLLGQSFQSVSAAGGIKLIARSASAVMVRLGLTPRLAATTDPSQMYIFL